MSPSSLQNYYAARSRYVILASPRHPSQQGRRHEEFDLRRDRILIGQPRDKGGEGGERERKIALGLAGGQERKKGISDSDGREWPLNLIDPQTGIHKLAPAIWERTPVFGRGVKLRGRSPAVNDSGCFDWPPPPLEDKVDLFPLGTLWRV